MSWFFVFVFFSVNEVEMWLLDVLILMELLTITSQNFLTYSAQKPSDIFKLNNAHMILG